MKSHSTSPYGRKGFYPFSIVAIIIWKCDRNTTFKKIADDLAYQIYVRCLNLKKSTPATSTLHNIFSKLSIEFIEWCILDRPELYGDATGFSTTGTETWRDIKADPKKRKKFVKLHILTTRKGVIISLYVTQIRCRFTKIRIAGKKYTKG